MFGNEDRMALVTAVQIRYQDYLMKIPHVVGVGVGFASIGSTVTNEPALVVLVDQKLPDDLLPPEQRIPKIIEGVRVDVQQTGEFTAGGGTAGDFSAGGGDFTAGG